MKPLDLSLYLVLDPELCRARTMAETACAAVRGGATVVQLRDKTASTLALVETGRAIRAALDGTGVPLIVNDDADAAVAMRADGLHVGRNDMSAVEARRCIGPDMILGLSVETPEAGRLVPPSIVDYVGAGPVFATATKPDHAPAVGLDGLAALIEASPVPAVAIGGLKATHVPAILETGAQGVAVVSAICGQKDPEAEARRLADSIRLWQQAARRRS